MFATGTSKCADNDAGNIPVMMAEHLKIIYATLIVSNYCISSPYVNPGLKSRRADGCKKKVMAKENNGKSSRFIHRDISWLDFNYRVLQEAKDPNVPLMERLKFLAIYSSNLDEFFRVRVANHRNLLQVGRKTIKELDYDPAAVLLKIQKIVSDQAIEFGEIFQHQIVPELKRHDVHLVAREELTQEQEAFVDTYFQENLLPFVQPVLLVKDKIRPFLNNKALYLAILMRDKEGASTQDQYGIIKIPSDHLPRFIELPSKKQGHELIMLDEIVRHSVMWLFPGYQIINTYSIKLTRDGELYIDDEYQGDLVKKIKTSLLKRDVGPASRLVYDKTIPPQFLHYLMNVLGVEKLGLFPEGHFHNNFDFFKFPSFGMDHLRINPCPRWTMLPLPMRIQYSNPSEQMIISSMSPIISMNRSLSFSNMRLRIRRSRT